MTQRTEQFAAPKAAEWVRHRERGSLWLLKVMAFLSLRLGRRTSRVILYGIAAYFFSVSAECAASFATLPAPGTGSSTHGPRALPANPRLCDDDSRSRLSDRWPKRKVPYHSRRRGDAAGPGEGRPRRAVVGSASGQLRGHALLEPASKRAARRHGHVRRKRTQDQRHPRGDQSRLGAPRSSPWAISMPCSSLPSVFKQDAFSVGVRRSRARR